FTEPARRSTRNQKIERIWVDVGEGFVRRWRVFFTRLEGLHSLDPSNPAHLWLLQRLFLDEIQADADKWVHHWNTHSVSGKHQNQTPSDIRHLAKVTVGMYEDEYADTDPDILSEHFGVQGPPTLRRRGQTGAGHSEDTDDEDAPMEDDSDGNSDTGDDGLVAKIIADQQTNIRHAAIKVARHKNPFATEEGEEGFWATLDQLVDVDYLPQGMNICEDEWDEEGYPTHELLIVGKGKEPLRVELPQQLWLPRAQAWCRAISVLTRILDWAETPSQSGSSDESASDFEGTDEE
ncbi:uncharacterized protein C8Q71DRAFT_701022, partial [Rhodofomes roseus]